MNQISICLLIYYYSLLYNVQGCTESVSTASGTHAPSGKICSGDLIFDENFDQFNLRIWQHENSLGGAGNAFQWYTNNRSNSFVENGILHIKPTFLADEKGEDFLYSGTLEIYGGTPYDGCTDPESNGCKRTGTQKLVLNPVKSAKIRTLESFAFKYGKVEIRAKIPAGDWLWPAIWMMPKYNTYSTWPASGEVDIMESRGNRQLFYWTGKNIGTKQVTSTLHYGPNYRFDPYQYSHFEVNHDTGFDEDFHRYQMEWTPDNFTFSIDDVKTGTITPPEGGFWELGRLNKTGTENPWGRSPNRIAPFDDEFYIILNVAVGGVTFPDFVAINVPGYKPWINGDYTAPTEFWKARDTWVKTWNLTGDDYHFKIDYVKVWAL